MVGWLRILCGLSVVIGVIGAGYSFSQLDRVDTSGLEQLCREGNQYACKMIDGVAGMSRAMAWLGIVSGLAFAAFFGSVFGALATLLERTGWLMGQVVPLDEQAEGPPPRRAEPRL